MPATYTSENLEFPIYNADGTAFHNLILRKSSYDETIMSLGRKISGDVYFDTNTLDVTMQEYIVYEDVHYTLVNPPTVVREGMAADNSELKGMTRYSFTFYHPETELSNIPFTDVAINAPEQMYKSQDKEFYWIGTLQDYINKLNGNLANTQWVARMTSDPEVVAKANETSNVLSFNNNYIGDALKTAYDTWAIPFTIDKLDAGDEDIARGKVFAIYFGKPSNEIYAEAGSSTPFVFKCGQGLGLKNDSRTPKNNKIITRIVGCGSEDNVPYGYPQIRWWGDDDATQTQDGYLIYDGIMDGQNVRLIKHPFTRNRLMPSVYSQSVFNKVSPYLERSDSTLVPNPNYNPNIELVDYYDAIDEQGHQYVNHINPSAPSVEIHTFDDIKPKTNPNLALDSVEAYDTEEEIEQRTAQRIDEADFLTYLDQEAQWCGLSLLIEDQRALLAMKAAYNVGEDASYEKTGGATTIKWSLTFSNGQCYAYYCSSIPLTFKYYVGEADEEEEETPTTAVWDDTMDADGKYKQSYFKATLPILDFDVYACASITQEMNLYMRSGLCNGCTFEVQVNWEDYKLNFYHEDGTFDPVAHTQEGDGHVRDITKYPDSRTTKVTVIVKKDLNTFGRLMPNTFQTIAAGDKFVILGISLPQSYVTNAENELDEAMKEYMLENNVYYFEYPLKFDEYFLTTHQYILSQIRCNTIVRFDYANEPTKVLYVKQIGIKWGSSTLPQYSITLTDDIEIVLNQVGQVTEDVSRLRVQMSEIQKYYGIGGGSGDGVSGDYLSRIMDDVAEGRITFQQGLDAIGSVVFHSEVRSDNFVHGMDTTGRGWRIDELGNGEMESLRVRSFLEVIELLVNRLQAQEGDTLFTDNDQIEYVETKTYNGDTYYKLTLKEKWEGYYTAINFPNNIIKGIINTAAARAGNVTNISDAMCVESDGSNKYYTSWMKVINPNDVGDSVGDNQVCVILYADNLTPAQKNFPPCQLMTIARWGCDADADAEGLTEGQREEIRRRQRLFTISVTDGRITKLTGVRTPILQEWNYGTTLGILPDFVRNNWTSVAERLIDGRDYLYAQGIVVGDFIKVDINGAPLTNYVDCGEWVNGGAQGVTPSVGHGIYLHNEYNETNLQWETHDVWHNGAYWRCLRHQPVETITQDVTTYEYREPTDVNTLDWQKLLESGHDGVSPSYYVEQSYAWSSASSGNTAPQDVSTWTSYVPSNSDASKPYLWMRSRTMTYNSNTRSYDAGAYTYTRINGENGTGVQIKGSIPASATDANAWLIANVQNPQTGDCYIYQADGHLWVWTGTQWQDVGQIKGSDGANAYIHIAWAHAIDPTRGYPYPAQDMGFTTTKQAGEYYEWMGVCSDMNAQDPTDPAVYEWNEIKGERGYSAIRLDLDNENDSVLYRTSDASSPLGTLPETTWTLYMGSDDISNDVVNDATNRRFTVSGCTAQWVNASTRRTIRVTGVSNATATVTVYITYSGQTYTCVMSLKRLVGLDKYEIVCTPSSVAVNVNDSTLDSASQCNVVVYRTDAQTGNREKITALIAPYELYIISVYESGINSLLHVDPSDYGNNGYTWNVYRSLSAYRVVFANGTITAADTSNALDIETIPLVKARNGVAGENVVRIDLSNELDTLLYKADGQTRIGDPITTQVRMYDGYDDITSSITSSLSIYERSSGVPTTGCSLSGNTLTVSHITGDSEYVTLRAYYNEEYYYATFSIKRLVGVNKYELVCEPDSFSINTSVDNVTQRTCTIRVYKTDSQSGERSLATSISGLYLYYAAENNAPQLLTYSSGSATFTAQAQYTFYRIFLLDATYNASTYSQHIVDYETIPFISVSNGANAMYLDLDNEMDGAPINNNGVVRFTTSVTINAALYNGLTPITSGITSNDVTASSIGGVAPTIGTISGTTGRIPITYTFTSGRNVGTSDRFTATISITYNSRTYSHVFTLTAIRSGAIYNLLPSQDAIHFADGDTTDVSIGCGYTKNDNGTITQSNSNYQIDSRYSIFYKLSTSNTWAWLKDSSVGSTYGLVNIPANTTATNITFVLSDATSYANVETANSNTIDKETVPILRDGTSGASPLIADIDNEMDSVSCDETGRVASTQTRTTAMTLYNGMETPEFTITSVVRRFGTSSTYTYSTSGTTSSYVTVSWSGTTTKTITIQYNVSATLAPTITDRDEFTINAQVTIGGTTYNRSCKFVVAAVVGDVYNLLPSVSEIRADRDANGNYLVNGSSTFRLTCGYTKDVNGTITTPSTDVSSKIDGRYTIFYRRRVRSTQTWNTVNGNTTWYRYNTYKNNSTYSLYELPLNTYDAVEFIISTTDSATTTSPSNIVDRETIYVVANGMNGASGETYFITSSLPSVLIPSGSNTATMSNVTLNFYKKSGTSAAEAFNCYYIIYRKQGGSLPPLSSGTSTTATISQITVTRNTDDAVVVRIFASSSSSVWLAEYDILVTADGNAGENGKMGRNYYYKGLWTDYTSSEYFTVTDAEAPFFAMLRDGSTTAYNYWVWVGSNGNKYYTNDNKPSSTNDDWELMVTDFKYLITEAMFTNFAKLGSGIFNEDWMFSQYGSGTRAIWSTTTACTSTSAVQVGGTTFRWSASGNYFNVVSGREYTVNVTAYVASSSYTMRLRMYYYDTTLQSNVMGYENVLVSSTSSRIYTMTFVAAYTGYAYVCMQGSANATCGYVTRITIAACESTEYEKMSPSFVNDDDLVLFKSTDNAGGKTINNTSIVTGDATADPSSALIGGVPFYVIGGKQYKVRVETSNTGGTTGTFGLYSLERTTAYEALITRRSTYNESVSNSTRGWNELTFQISSSYSGIVYLMAYASANSSSQKVFVYNATVCAIDPFVPRVAIDWFSGYAHFAGGNARFYPDGSLAFRNGYMSGFLRSIPRIIDGSNINDFVTTDGAWIKFSDFGASAQTFAAMDGTKSVDFAKPTPIVDLRFGSTMVFKAWNEDNLVVHLPFLTNVFNGTAYSNFGYYTGSDKYTEQARARSYVGSCVEIYNVCGQSAYIVGAYNPYADCGGTASTPHAMATGNDEQNVVSKLHRLENGMMVRLECKRLLIGNMFEASAGSGQEIIYWEVVAGAIGFSANQFTDSIIKGIK